LIAPPDPPEPETIGAIATSVTHIVIVHQVVGILGSEYDFAVAHGGAALWSLLARLPAAPLIDEKRLAAV
jgi:hypothetical protein